MAAAAVPLLIGSTVLSASGSIIQGENEKAAADFRAKQLRYRANQAAGHGQRAAIEEKRQANILAGRAQAVAAASGGGASDPTVINRIAGIISEGEYRSLVALYEGDEESNALKTEANIANYEGRAARSAGYLEAAGSVFAGASTMFGNYGQGGPKFKRRSGTSDADSQYSGAGYSYSSYPGYR